MIRRSKVIKNGTHFILAIMLLIILIIALVDIYIVDIPYMYGNGAGIIFCIFSIIVNLIVAFTD